MDQQYSFSVTNYAGKEDAILQMRNRNRATRRARQFLDWRYIGEQKDVPPLTFWMHDAAGQPVAMASLIFRPYFVDGKKVLFAVLGDISVNEEHRGEGLSTALFRFMNEHIAKANVPCSFVLPNKAAERALSSVGWQTIGYVMPLVCVIEPVAKFKKLLRVDAMARLASFGLRLFTRTLVQLQTQPDISMRPVQGFDADFQKLWDRFPKENLILRDRSQAGLDWRYCKQPEKNYEICKFFRHGQFIGYVVSDISKSDGMCLVSDFFVANDKFIRPCMAAFLRHTLKNKEVVTVRIVLAEDGIYARHLWKFSFFKREPVTACQIFHPADERMKNAANWFITAGDKDA